MTAHYDLNLHSLMISDDEHLFTCLLATCNFHLEKILNPREMEEKLMLKKITFVGFFLPVQMKTNMDTVKVTIALEKIIKCFKC